MICDPSGVVALAGVMGGEATEVSDSTVNVLLESACFDPESISRTSRSLGLISEASLRFERTVDRTACVAALDRAAALMAEVAGGAVAPGVVDVYPAELEPRALTLRIERLQRILGDEIPAKEARETLERLGCEVSGDDALEVVVPSFRPDLEREIDLIEEVLRIWGMERVKSTLPHGSGRAGGLTAEQRLRDRIGATLRAAGLNETMTYAFADPSRPRAFRHGSCRGRAARRAAQPDVGRAGRAAKVAPARTACAACRTTSGAAWATCTSTRSGRCFWTAEGRKQPKERSVLAGVLAGSWQPPSWNEPAEPLDFFDGKGVLEVLARELAIERFKVRAAEKPWLQPGRSAEVLVGGDVVGWIGEVHPRVLARFEADAPVSAFELDLAKLVRSDACRAHVRRAARGSLPSNSTSRSWSPRT